MIESMKSRNFGTALRVSHFWSGASLPVGGELVKPDVGGLPGGPEAGGDEFPGGPADAGPAAKTFQFRKCILRLVQQQLQQSCTPCSAV